MANRVQFDSEQVEEMAKRYELGDSLTTLANDFRVSIPTVRKYLSNRGVNIRKAGRPKQAGAVQKVKETTKPTESVTTETTTEKSETSTFSW